MVGSLEEALPVKTGRNSASAAPNTHPRRPASEGEYQDFIQQNLSRNYVAHVLHGLLGQTGFRLVNAPTFLPAYVLLLSGSEFVVGLARAIQYLGMFLSPLIAANLIEHRRRVLPMGFLMGGAMRLQVLGLALAGLWLAPDKAVPAICVFLFFFGFFMGMQGVIFNYLMSKVIPVKRRGRLLGLRNALAGVTAALVAYLGGEYLVGSNLLGDGYAATFLLAFVLTSIGLGMLLLVREPQPPEVRPPSQFLDRIRDLPALFREDRGYTYYFLCRALATMGRMATPFYIVYARDTIGLTGTNIGVQYRVRCRQLGQQPGLGPDGRSHGFPPGLRCHPRALDSVGGRHDFFHFSQRLRTRLCGNWGRYGRVPNGGPEHGARIRPPGRPACSHRGSQFCPGGSRCDRPPARGGTGRFFRARPSLCGGDYLPVGRHRLGLLSGR